MKFFNPDAAEARREGHRKAQRDIDLVKQFIDVHNGRPDNKIARKFFGSLGDDVRPGPEEVEYRKITNKFQKEIRESGVIQVIHPANSPRVIVVELDMNDLPEQLAGMVQQLLNGQVPSAQEAAEALWARNPGITSEEVDEMAAEHGHLTREDECAGLQILREKIAERDGNN